MIRSIHISNFKRFAGESSEIVLGAPSDSRKGFVTSVVGGAATGKSTLVAALELLQSIARGIRRTEELYRGEWSAVSTIVNQPCDVIVDFDFHGSSYEYGLRLEYNHDKYLWLVESEWLSVGPSAKSRGLVFARTGSHVEVGGLPLGKGSYELDCRTFVLSTFVTPDRFHPLAHTRAYFAGLFLFGHRVGFLNDFVPDTRTPVLLSAHGENIGAWLSYQFSTHADFYRVLSDLLVRHLPQFYRFEVLRERRTGNHLALTTKTVEGHLRTVPIWQLSSQERMILLGCVVATVGRVFASADCVCDDYDGLECGCSGLAKEVSRIYAESGQLVAFQRQNHTLYPNRSVRL